MGEGRYVPTAEDIRSAGNLQLEKWCRDYDVPSTGERRELEERLLQRLGLQEGPPPEEYVPSFEDLYGAERIQLAKWCRDRGIPSEGSRESLLRRLVKSLGYESKYVREEAEKKIASDEKTASENRWWRRFLKPAAEGESGDRSVQATLIDGLAFAYENPQYFFAFLGLQFLISFISYGLPYGFKAGFVAALVFTFAWGIIFYLIPVILKFILGLLILLPAIAGLVIAVKVGAIEPLIVGVVGSVAMCIAIALAWLVFCCVPGGICAALTYAVIGKNYGTVPAIIVFLIVTVIFVRFLLPFAIGFGWTIISGTLSHRLCSSIAFGVSLLGVSSDMHRRGTEIFVDGRAARLTDLNPLARLWKICAAALSPPPTILFLWILVIAVIVGIACVRVAGRESVEGPGEHEPSANKTSAGKDSV
jgi:hypothetical protein